MALEALRHDYVKKVIDGDNDAVTIKGPDFENKDISMVEYINSMTRFGVQGSHLGLAVKEVNKMITWVPEVDIKERDEIRRENMKKYLIKKLKNKKNMDEKEGNDDPIVITDEEIEKSLKKKLEKREKEGDVDDLAELDPDTRCFIYLGLCTSVITSGMREAIAFLCKHSMVDVIVTTGGGIEEDIMKCLAPTYLGDFKVDENYCVDNGINRMANMLVPNKNYEMLEKFLLPVFEDCHIYQACTGYTYTPSRMIRRFGMELAKYEKGKKDDLKERRANNIHKDTKQNPVKSANNNNKRNNQIDDDDNDVVIPHDVENSFVYWCYKNAIPVFCPSFVDGSLGSIMYTHNTRSPGLVVDIVGDIRGMNDATGAGCLIDKELILKIYDYKCKKEKGEEIKTHIAIPNSIHFSYSSPAVKRGIILVGGGTVKHHIANANLLGRTDCAVDEGSFSSSTDDNNDDNENMKENGGKEEVEKVDEDEQIPDGGAHFCVYINTSQEFDSSDSGASPDEAVSWGKIHPRATPVKVWCEQSIALGLLIAGSFANSYHTPEGKKRWDEKVAIRQVISSYMDKEYYERKNSGFKTKDDKEGVPSFGNDYLTSYYTTKYHTDKKVASE